MESFVDSNRSGLVWHTACIPHSSLHFYSVQWLNHRGGRSIITFLHTRPLFLSLQPTARPWPDGCAAREQSAVWPLHLQMRWHEPDLLRTRFHLVYVSYGNYISKKNEWHSFSTTSAHFCSVPLCLRCDCLSCHLHMCVCLFVCMCTLLYL